MTYRKLPDKQWWWLPKKWAVTLMLVNTSINAIIAEIVSITRVCTNRIYLREKCFWRSSDCIWQKLDRPEPSTLSLHTQVSLLVTGTTQPNNKSLFYQLGSWSWKVMYFRSGDLSKTVHSGKYMIQCFRNLTLGTTSPICCTRFCYFSVYLSVTCVAFALQKCSTSELINATNIHIWVKTSYLL